MENGEATACPAPLGITPSPGCNKTFISDVNGEITCSGIEDCPQGFDWWDTEDAVCSQDPFATYSKCQDGKCKFQSNNCGYWSLCFNEDDNLGI